MGKRRPDCKTIADFRWDHGATMKQVGREFMLRCTELDRCGGELLAIAGSTFQAVNAQKRHFGGKKRARLIEAYLQHLDRQEGEETLRQTPTAEQMPQKLGPWQARQPRDQCYQQPQ